MASYYIINQKLLSTLPNKCGCHNVFSEIYDGSVWYGMTMAHTNATQLPCRIVS